MFKSRVQWRKCFDMFVDDIKHNRTIRWNCREWTFNSKAYKDLPERVNDKHTVQNKITKSVISNKPRRSLRLANKPPVKYSK